jgi:hypothetical protein
MTGRSQGYLAATACVLGFGACTAPTEHTDLRPDGPPEVLAVLASDDTDGAGAVETATFCKVGDAKRPGLVPAALAGPTQVCPDDPTMGADEVTDTQPVDWYVRIMFDELLNPDKAETLLDPTGTKPCAPTEICKGSLKSTQPVTITCAGVDVPYDGYYDPSGNSFTWPLGPSLFIQPIDTSTVATGSECEVKIKPDVVTDKDGNHVPMAELAGPYTFKIAPLALLSENPAQPKDLTMPSTISASKPLVLTFNATMGQDPKNPTSLNPAQVKIVDAADCMGNGTVTTHTVNIQNIQLDLDNKAAIDIGDIPGDPGDPKATPPKPATPPTWKPGLTYIVTFPMGIKVNDFAGGPGSFPDANKLTICFKTAT